MRNEALILPPVFVSRCKDLIQSHTDHICSWFNPAPSPSTITNVTYLPDKVPCSETKLRRSKEVILSVKGIIVESNRILPYITLDFTPEITTSLMDSLAVGNDEIEEVTDNIIVRDTENDYDEDEDEDEDEDKDEDEDEDEDDESEYDEDDRFERVQKSLDAAREELERLRRERNRG